MAVPRPIPPLTAPDPEAVAETKAMVAEHHDRWAAERPNRLAVLSTGPTLRDPEAAADCHCGCHPSSAQLSLHDGGIRCPCQLTDEERRDAWAEAMAMIDPPSEDEEARQVATTTAFDAAAAALGVTVEQWGGMAPFQIVGVVAGRAFYLRCRHGGWTVTVAGDDDPLGDPVSGRSVVYRVAEGDEDDLFDDGSGRPGPVVALHIAVRAVTDFQTRRTCAHVPAEGAVVFCPFCGVRLAEADRWREV